MGGGGEEDAGVSGSRPLLCRGRLLFAIFFIVAGALFPRWNSCSCFRDIISEMIGTPSSFGKPFARRIRHKPPTCRRGRFSGLQRHFPSGRKGTARREREMLKTVETYCFITTPVPHQPLESPRRDKSVRRCRGLGEASPFIILVCTLPHRPAVETLRGRSGYGSRQLDR